MLLLDQSCQGLHLPRPSAAGQQNRRSVADVPAVDITYSDTGLCRSAWLSAGAEVHPPHDTERGPHEGAVVDPGGSVIRFGSPRLLSC
jgi:hypothetical protein